jgi:hypothetical protein
MIVTDRFVFLHLHKSGGSFVNECLLRFIPTARSVGYHLPRLLVPTESAHLPVLGFVRNPWSYYVSWFNFQSQRPAPNALFQILSEGGRLDFSATLRNLLELGSGSSMLPKVLAALPASYGAHGLNLPKFALAPIANTGLGFYSYLYSYLYGEHDRKLTVERVELLRPTLLEYLQRVGHRVTYAIEDFVAHAPQRNVSAHGHYTEFYSDKTRELVADKDRSIAERHGYSFGND